MNNLFSFKNFQLNLFFILFIFSYIFFLNFCFVDRKFIPTVVHLYFVIHQLSKSSKLRFTPIPAQFSEWLNDFQITKKLPLIRQIKEFCTNKSFIKIFTSLLKCKIPLFHIAWNSPPFLSLCVWIFDTKLIWYYTIIRIYIHFIRQNIRALHESKKNTTEYMLNICYCFAMFFMT